MLFWIKHNSSIAFTQTQCEPKKLWVSLPLHSTDPQEFSKTAMVPPYRTFIQFWNNTCKIKCFEITFMQLGLLWIKSIMSDLDCKCACERMNNILTVENQMFYIKKKNSIPWNVYIPIYLLAHSALNVLLSVQRCLLHSCALLSNCALQWADRHSLSRINLGFIQIHNALNNVLPNDNLQFFHKAGFPWSEPDICRISGTNFVF